MPLGGIVPNWLVALPFLAERPGTGFVAITEAQTGGSGRVLEARLAPRADEPEPAASGTNPLRTP